jgi:hypothetical protein
MGVIQKHPIAFVILLIFCVGWQLPNCCSGDPDLMFAQLSGSLIGIFVFSWGGTAIWARMWVNEEEGEQDERLYELTQIPFKCDLCGAEFSQSKGEDGCPECYSSDISEV